MLKKLILIFSIFAFGALFLLGCSTNEQNYTKGQNLENKNKDELIIAAGGEPEGGFDPTTGWGRYGSPLFQSTLLKRDSDMNIVNDLATEYSVSSDGLVWTLKLRRDVKFSDGTPLTAADVVFTYETASKSSSVVDLSMLESIEAVDDYTINFTLKNTQSTFINILTNTGIVPKHAYSQDYSQNPIGSGPFKFVNGTKDNSLL